MGLTIEDGQIVSPAELARIREATNRTRPDPAPELVAEWRDVYTPWDSMRAPEPHTERDSGTPSIADHNARVRDTATPGSWSDGRNLSAVRARDAAISDFIGTENPQLYRPEIVAAAQQRGTSYNDEVDRHNGLRAATRGAGTELPPEAREVWEYNGDFEDPRLETLATENGPHSPEAKFAVLSATSDDLTTQIDAAPPIPAYELHRVDLINQRRGIIMDLSEGDGALYASAVGLVNDGSATADAIIAAPAQAYRDISTGELVDNLEQRTRGGATFDPIGHGIELEIHDRTDAHIPERRQVARSAWGHANPATVAPHAPRTSRSKMMSATSVASFFL